MNPMTDPLYAGISGIRLGVESYELDHGVVFTQTFAHLMAPLLMAFSPAMAGKPHPGPWSAVRGGFGFDIHLQLHVPACFALPNWFDRLNTVWWIAALVRLKTTPAVLVQVIADRPFALIPESRGEAEILPVEANPARLMLTKEARSTLEHSDLTWIRQHWLVGGAMMHESQAFSDALQAFDFSTSANKPSLALLTLWSALEELFSPGRQELRFRVSALIASFLAPRGAERLRLHKRVLKLYDARSKVAHSTAMAESSALTETYELTRRILLKMIEEGRVPDRSELEERMFIT